MNFLGELIAEVRIGIDELGVGKDYGNGMRHGQCFGMDVE